MKNISDELLNKMSDNEITNDELNLINEIIKNNPTELNRLKAQKITEKLFTELSLDKAPDGFTDKVMNQINLSSEFMHRGSRFFASMITILLLAIIGFTAYALLNLEGNNSEPLFRIEFIKSSIQSFGNLLKSPSNLLESNSLFWIGISLTFIMLITGYFAVGAQKSNNSNLSSN
ncbi:MAG: hypothetical protein K9G44_12195 [Melioribacteraceae bacterium]|nr:hypothetical protein [Melioribacteraceae bacterium]